MTDPRVRIRTPLGEIVLRVAASRAPLSAAAFLDVVDGYDGGLTFWRALDRPGETPVAMIQGGAQSFEGHAAIPHEPTSETGLSHVAGTVSLGRLDPGTAIGAGFFFCLTDIPRFDAGGGLGDDLGFAAFAHVEEGMEVAQAILALPRSDEAPIEMLRGQMLCDPLPILAIERIA